MPMIKLSLQTIYGGAAIERFDRELQNVLANIVDVNTPAKKPRKVTLEVELKETGISVIA